MSGLVGTMQYGGDGPATKARARNRKRRARARIMVLFAPNGDTLGYMVRGIRPGRPAHGPYHSREEALEAALRERKDNH